MALRNLIFKTHLQRILPDLLAVHLVLLTPFFVFLKYHQYAFFRLEILICLIGLVVVGLLCNFALVIGRWVIGGWVLHGLVMAGLLTLFVDLQLEQFNRWSALTIFVGVVVLAWLLRNNLTRIIAAVFVAIFASTLLLPVGNPQKKVTITDSGKGVGTENLPVVVHLILDEQIGIEGIPTQVPANRQIKEALKSFYTSHGFRLFGKAYSQYFNTIQSLSTLTNFTADLEFGRFIDKSGKGRVVKQNEYFHAMTAKGYRIHVYQSDFMDFCRYSMTDLASCFTYPSTSIKSIESLQLSAIEKAWVIASTFVDLSSFYNMLSLFYKRQLRVALASKGWLLPGWDWDRRIGPNAVLPVIEHLRAEVAAAPRGSMFFAHLLMPHAPYVYDAQCQIKSVGNWLDRTAHDALWPSTNTPESRAQRYAAYLGQVRCLHSRLQDLFGGMHAAGTFDDALILIHGDHGSRITLVDPDVIRSDLLSPEDYVDAFSTLFAVKAPEYEPGYDVRFLPINELFADVVLYGVHREKPGLAAPPFVFLRSEANRPMKQQPMANFGNGSR